MPSNLIVTQIGYDISLFTRHVFDRILSLVSSMDGYSKRKESLLQDIYIIKLYYIRLAAKTFRLHLSTSTE